MTQYHSLSQVAFTTGCVKFLACGDSGRHGIAEFAEKTPHEHLSKEITHNSARRSVAAVFSVFSASSVPSAILQAFCAIRDSACQKLYTPLQPISKIVGGVSNPYGNCVNQEVSVANQTHRYAA